MGGGLLESLNGGGGGVDSDDVAMRVNQERIEPTVSLFPLGEQLCVVGMELARSVDAVDVAEFAEYGLAAVGIDANVDQVGLDVVILHVGDARLRFGRVPEGDEHIVAAQLLEREGGVGVGYGEVGCHAAHRRFCGIIIAR